MSPAASRRGEQELDEGEEDDFIRARERERLQQMRKNLSWEEGR